MAKILSRGDISVPFFLRKSVSVGPFRFNLSKSGIGLSAGVTGLRFGTGPRGRYVHAGRGGIYYRKTLSSDPEGVLFNDGRPIDSPAPPPSARPQELEQVDSGSVLAMVDASSADLLKEINEKQRLIRFWPIALICTFLLCVGLHSQNAPVWIVFVAGATGVLVTIFVRSRDVLRKTVSLIYDLEPEVEQTYRLLFECIEELRSAKRVWLVEGKGQSEDAKYQGGATQIVRRQPIDITIELPECIASNLEPPAIPAGRQTLFFFPDMLLIREGNSFGAVNYKDIDVEVRDKRFVEDGQVPQDAKIVGTTWKYVNKSGGPDRRFKNNEEIPLVLYEEIQLTSSTGLNELFQVSRQGIGVKIKNAMSDMSSLQPEA
jgi:hypothetical protein